MKFGIVGTGVMGERHARVLNSMKDCELVGVADIDIAKSGKVAQAEGCKAFNSSEKLMDSVDALIVAVPTKAHAAVAIPFLEGGIPVLVEKPISDNLEDAQKMINAAKDNGTIAMVGHIERFNPIVMELKKILNGERILQIEAKRYGPWLGRDMGMDVVLDLMIHDIDVVRFLTDGTPTGIKSIGGKKGKYYDYVTALLKINDTSCILSANIITQGKFRKIDITTDSRFIRGDYIEQNIEIYRKSLPSFVVEKEGMQYKQEHIMEKVEIYKKEPLRLELQHFADCIREKKTPEITLEDGFANLRICLEIIEEMKKVK